MQSRQEDIYSDVFLSEKDLKVLKRWQQLIKQQKANLKFHFDVSLLFYIIILYCTACPTTDAARKTLDPKNG